jgi:hypothetical protein
MILIIAIILGAAVFLLGGTLSTSHGPQPPAPSPAIAALAAAIATAEGSNPEWNNPGDLTKSFGFSTAGVANSAGVLKFQTSADGWNALYAQLSLIVSGGSHWKLGTSLSDFGLGYSGGDPNWAKNVANSLGVSEDSSLGDLLT